MGISQVSGPRPGRDGDNGENSSVDLLSLARAGSCRMLVAHIGDRNGEIKPFPVRESVVAATMLVLFTPIFPIVYGICR